MSGTVRQDFRVNPLQLPPEKVPEASFPVPKPVGPSVPGHAPPGAAPAPSQRSRSGAGSEPPIPFSGGDQVGHYELIRLLGRGGMGEVWQARDTKLPRKVAIKFLHASSPTEAKRFMGEAQVTALCAHENIVTIYDVGDAGGRPFLALEYLQGAPLSTIIADKKPLKPARAVELIVPVLRGLQFAHQSGIVHRDLKPDNLFVTNRSVVKILDFGISKPVRRKDMEPESTVSDAARPGATPLGHAYELPAVFQESALTLEGTIVGTPGWMSPEHWHGKASRSSDIWSIGVILFRMLAGRHPLEGLSGFQHAVVATSSQPLPSLRNAAPSVPAELAAVVDRCLRLRPEERYPDVASLLRDLEPFLPGQRARVLDLDTNPYAGLSPFQEADADRFFGRDREIGALLSFIHDQPFTTVAGPSGAGKSSFVRAGVIPALKRSGEAWEVMVLRPGRSPLAAIAGRVASMAGALSGTAAEATPVALDLEREQALIERLRAEPGYAGLVARKYAKREQRKLLFVVDQLEELYTLVPDVQERQAFTACLAGIADDASSPTRVVATIRSDLLDRVNEDSEMMAEITRGLFFLGPPSREGLRDALVKPAEMAGYHFESETIVEEMLGHLETTPGALPLLQFSVSQLWETRDRVKKVFTEASYTAIGGVAGALARHADSVLNELSQDLREVAKAIFLRLVTPERTHATLSVQELQEVTSEPAHVERLVEHFAQARLLVLRKTEGTVTAEIVHESLIHSWPTLRHWLDALGAEHVFLDQVHAAVKQWERNNRDRDLLWRGELADEARKFLGHYRGEVPARCREFIEATLDEVDREKRRARKWRLLGFGALGVVTAGALIAAGLIAAARAEAVRQANAARQAAVLERQARELAQQKAEAATRAEEAARESQRAAEHKERERALQQKRAEAATETATLANEELASKNVALQNAVTQANRARRAETTAKNNAQQAAEKLDAALKAEQERLRRLKDSVGQPVFSGFDWKNAAGEAP